MIASVAAKSRIQCRARVGRGEGVLESFAIGIGGCSARVTHTLFKSIFSLRDARATGARTSVRFNVQDAETLEPSAPAAGCAVKRRQTPRSGARFRRAGWRSFVRV